MMVDKLVVPRRKVKRNWYVGLNSDPVDRSHPDVDDKQIILEAEKEKLVPRKLYPHSELLYIYSSFFLCIFVFSLSTRDFSREVYPCKNSCPYIYYEKIFLAIGTHLEFLVTFVETNQNKTSPPTTISTEDERKSNGTQIGADIKQTVSANDSSVNISSVGTVTNGTSTGRRLLEDNNLQRSQESESKNNTNADVRAATVENEGALEAEADSSFELLRDSEELADEYNYDYDDYVDESMWGDEEWKEGQHETQEDYVNIDSHILCTPVSYNFLYHLNCMHVFVINSLDGGKSLTEFHFLYFIRS